MKKIIIIEYTDGNSKHLPEWYRYSTEEDDCYVFLSRDSVGNTTAMAADCTNSAY